MIQKSLPDDYFPVALKKLFDGKITGPLEISCEEIQEARSWKRQLDLDILEIENQLNSKSF